VGDPSVREESEEDKLMTDETDNMEG